jgi:cytochrome c2
VRWRLGPALAATETEGRAGVRAIAAAGAVLAVLTLPSVAALRTPVWKLSPDLATQAVAASLIFALSWLVAERVSRRPLVRLAAAIVLIAAGFGALYATFGVRPELQFSRALAGAGAIVAAAAAVALAQPWWPLLSAIAFGVAGLSSAAWLAKDVAKGPPPPAPPITSRSLTAGAYTLAWKAVKVVDDSRVRWGGGLTAVGERFVAMTGGGTFYELTPQGNGALARRLTIPSPLNSSEFEASVSADVNRDWFRSHDVIARPVAQGWQLFVSHHKWDGTGRCFATVLSRLDLSPSLDAAGAGWTPIFTAGPCLPVGGSHRGVPFAGLEAGGRLAWLGADELLMTLGDHQFDGVNRAVAAGQDPAYDYGKTLVVNVADGKTRRFTQGHRNAQGLFIDASGKIWSTEHGPRGGDELNVLVEARNYGWPYVSLGTDYGTTVWPTLANATGAVSFTPPVYAWIPSMGISNLIRLSGPKFGRWKDNLLVGTLRAQTLLRVVVEGERVTLVEPIPIQRRIRDLAETPQGDVWLWSDEGDLIVLAPAAEEEKTQQALSACTGCHIIDRDLRSGGLGPNLYGVVDRPIASNATFTAYSPALKRVGGVWTAARLDAYLENPARFAPGTSMAYAVNSPEERALIIAALRAQRSQ